MWSDGLFSGMFAISCILPWSINLNINVLVYSTLGRLFSSEMRGCQALEVFLWVVTWLVLAPALVDSCKNLKYLAICRYRWVFFRWYVHNLYRHDGIAWPGLGILQVRNGSLELLETVLKPFDFFPGNYFLDFLTVVNVLLFCYIFVVLMPRK